MLTTRERTRKKYYKTPKPNVALIINNDEYKKKTPIPVAVSYKNIHKGAVQKKRND